MPGAGGRKHPDEFNFEPTPKAKSPLEDDDFDAGKAFWRQRAALFCAWG